MYKPNKTRALRHGIEGSQCELFNMFLQQSEHMFGFIPLSGFVLPQCKNQGGNITCPIKQHVLVKNSGLPNYMGCRIPLKSQLNLEKWEEMLVGYWDTQVLYLLTYGFPLDFNRNRRLTSDAGNHTSADKYPKDVEEYIKEEVSYGAVRPL